MTPKYHLIYKAPLVGSFSNCFCKN